MIIIIIIKTLSKTIMRFNLGRICRVLAIRITVRIEELVMLPAGSADARTLTMNACVGANFTRIQDAINNSNKRKG